MDKEIHMRNAKMEVIQGKPGGLFYSGVSSKIVFSYDEGQTVIPYVSGISVYVGCTKLTLIAFGSETAHPYVFTECCKKCNKCAQSV